MGRDGTQSRQSVLDAVGRIVTQRGLEGIRVREIAKEANLSPGSVLYHFPDHEDLLFAVHQDTVRRYVEGRRQAAEVSDDQPEDDPAQRLLTVMRAGVPPYADEQVIRLLFELHGLARRSDRHAALLSQLWRDELAVYVDILEAGVGAKSFTLQGNSDEVAAGLLALEDGLVLHQMSNNAAFDGEVTVRLFAQSAAAQLGCPRLADLRT